MDKIVEELGMESITDGCNTEQVKRFCEIRKIAYYALNYKCKTFDTNNHMNYHSNLPRLVFMCAETIYIQLKTKKQGNQYLKHVQTSGRTEKIQNATTL